MLRKVTEAGIEGRGRAESAALCLNVKMCRCVGSCWPNFVTVYYRENKVDLYNRLKHYGPEELFLKAKAAFFLQDFALFRTSHSHGKEGSLFS